jgi:hypothetical protein
MNHIHSLARICVVFVCNLYVFKKGVKVYWSLQLCLLILHSQGTFLAILCLNNNNNNNKKYKGKKKEQKTSFSCFKKGLFKFRLHYVLRPNDHSKAHDRVHAPYLL